MISREELVRRMDNAANGALVGFISSLLKAIDDGEDIHSIKKTTENLLYRHCIPEAKRLGIDKATVIETWEKQGYRYDKAKIDHIFD